MLEAVADEAIRVGRLLEDGKLQILGVEWWSAAVTKIDHIAFPSAAEPIALQSLPLHTGFRLKLGCQGLPLECPSPLAALGADNVRVHFLRHDERSIAPVP